MPKPSTTITLRSYLSPPHVLERVTPACVTPRASKQSREQIDLVPAESRLRSRIVWIPMTTDREGCLLTKVSFWNDFRCLCKGWGCAWKQWKSLLPFVGLGCGFECLKLTSLPAHVANPVKARAAWSLRHLSFFVPFIERGKVAVICGRARCHEACWKAPGKMRSCDSETAI